MGGLFEAYECCQTAAAPAPASSAFLGAFFTILCQFGAFSACFGRFSRLWAQIGEIGGNDQNRVKIDFFLTKTDRNGLQMV